jgi:hypothetical protein
MEREKGSGWNTIPAIQNRPQRVIGEHGGKNLKKGRSREKHVDIKGK